MISLDFRPSFGVVTAALATCFLEEEDRGYRRGNVGGFVRAPRIESETVAEQLLQATKVQMSETLLLLKERTAVMQRHALALQEEAAKVRAMRRAAIGSPPESPLRSLSRTAWKALPLIEDSHARCPKCESPLKPFPPATNALLICTDCGFVAKPVEMRHIQA